MSVDRKAIDDMARIMNALNGTPSEPAPVMEANRQTPVASSSTGDPGIDAMKDILLRLQEVSSPVAERLVETAKEDVELRSALQTHATSKGARVGSWEIVVNEGARKSYDVIHATTEQPIAKDLYLYEAALGLVKRLNEGVTINDSRITNLLKLEEEYAKNRDDAAVYKKQQKTLRDRGEDDRAAIAEDRFDDARAKALEAQEHILRLAGLRR